MTSSKQEGMALIIVLAFLLVLTVIALASVRGIGVQVDMANNFEAASVSFQAAEEALRRAEDIVETTAFDDNDFWDGAVGDNNFNADCTLGLCDTVNFIDGQPGSNCRVEPTKVWVDDAMWANAGVFDVDFNRTAVANESVVTLQAKYLIEFRCYVKKVAEVGAWSSDEWAEYYRITVKVDGPNGKAPVMLQSTFRKN